MITALKSHLARSMRKNVKCGLYLTYLANNQVGFFFVYPKCAGNSKRFIHFLDHPDQITGDYDTLYF